MVRMVDKMTPQCRIAPKTSEAQELCKFFISKKKLTKKQLDRGVQAINFRLTTPKVSIAKDKTNKSTANNNRYELGELTERALKLIEKEHAPNAYHRYSKNSLSSLISSKKHLGNIRPPWIIDDFNGNTNKDKKIAKKVIKEIATIKVGIKGLRSGTKAYNVELTKRLIKWLVQPKNKGGLGITPSLIFSDQVENERTNLELLQAQKPKAHCTELCYLLYEIFRLAGLNAGFYLVYKNETGVQSITHVCVGLKLDPRSNAVTLVDPTRSSPKKWFNTPHKMAIPLSHSAMIGTYFSNKGIALYHQNELKINIPQKTVNQIGSFLGMGKKYNPFDPLMSYNLFSHHKNVQPDKRKALQYLNDSLALYPKFIDALKQKAKLLKKVSKPRSSK
jgi:hypothetical protein